MQLLTLVFVAVLIPPVEAEVDPHRVEPLPRTGSQPSRSWIHSVSPLASATDSYAKPLAAIQIEFREPMREGLENAKLVLDPPHDGTLAWIGPRRLMFTPTSRWRAGGVQNVRFIGTLERAAGGVARVDHRWSFTGEPIAVNMDAGERIGGSYIDAEDLSWPASRQTSAVANEGWGNGPAILDIDPLASDESRDHSAPNCGRECARRYFSRRRLDLQLDPVPVTQTVYMSLRTPRPADYFPFSDSDDTPPAVDVS